MSWGGGGEVWADAWLTWSSIQKTDVEGLDKYMV